jgi:uncharacterized membrane protein
MRHHFGRVDYLQILVILIVFLSAFIVNITTSSDNLIVHWNESGQPDGYASKPFVLFFFPIMILFFYILFLMVPYISHHDNLNDFYDNYGGFRLAMILFLSIVYYSIILQNFGFVININYIIIPAFAAVFFYLGHLISIAKPNHYIGFRTPWTIESDFVWKKTHDLSGFLFKSFAIFSLLVLMIPEIFLYVFLIPLIAMLLIIILYSKYVHTHYIKMKKEKDEEVKKVKEEHLQKISLLSKNKKKVSKKSKSKKNKNSKSSKKSSKTKSSKKK